MIIRAGAQHMEGEEREQHRYLHSSQSGWSRALGGIAHRKTPKKGMDDDYCDDDLKDGLSHYHRVVTSSRTGP